MKKKRNRLGKGWKEAAAKYIRACWHVPEYRYLEVNQEPPQRIAEIAMKEFRCRASYAFGNLRDHPRSQKYAKELFTNIRAIASIGFYLLENSR